MPSHASPTLYGAEPFAGDAGRIGVVLSHGFTGSPASIRPWAQRPATEGFSMRVPRLPRHGTPWQDLNTVTWHRWCKALKLAVMLVNFALHIANRALPFVRFLRRVVPSLKGIGGLHNPGVNEIDFEESTELLHTYAGRP